MIHFLERLKIGNSKKVVAEGRTQCYKLRNQRTSTRSTILFLRPLVVVAFLGNLLECHAAFSFVGSNIFNTVLCPKSTTSSKPTQAAVVSTLDDPSSRTKNADESCVRAAQDRAEKLARDNYSPYSKHAMNALLVNIREHPKPLPCTIACGTIPNDLPPGCLMRNGPNGGAEDMGFLDGDGMVHCITTPPKDSGRDITYSSTYIETKGRQIEKRINGARRGNAPTYVTYSGTLGAAPKGFPVLAAFIRNGLTFQTLLAQKDTCNTALACSGDRLLALMEQSPPTEIQISKDGSMETIENMLDLEGAVPNVPITGGCLGAHGRTDPVTGERVHVSYTSESPPYVRVDFFNPNWKLKKTLSVDVPTPVMVHDCALTQNYVVIMDFPLTIRPERMLMNAFPVKYEPGNGARIGLLPRSASSTDTADETLWFDVETGVVLHAANAFETDDGKVVLHGFKSNPQGEKSYILDYSPSFLYEWVLDPSLGKVTSERCLNPSIGVEFPVFEEELVGREYRYIYSLVVTSVGGPMVQFKTPDTGLLYDSVVKFAVVDGNDEEAGDVIDRYDLPEGWHCVSEPVIITKASGVGQYVLLTVTYVPPISSVDHDELVSSQCHILDGDLMSEGPLTIIDLPRHMNVGLHSLYLPWEKMI